MLNALSGNTSNRPRVPVPNFTDSSPIPVAATTKPISSGSAARDCSPGIDPDSSCRSIQLESSAKSVSLPSTAGDLGGNSYNTAGSDSIGGHLSFGVAGGISGKSTASEDWSSLCVSGILVYFSNITHNFIHISV